LDWKIRVKSLGNSQVLEPPSIVWLNNFD
jgi:hypothetical protein